jgi:hypothetical protein
MAAVSSTSPKPKDPLTPGQILYPLQETAMICESAGSDNARFHRITFGGSEQNPVATVRDSIELGIYDDIRDARAVTDGNQKQGVAILTKTGLTYVAVAKAGEAARAVPVSTKVDDAVRVIGFAPTRNLPKPSANQDRTGKRSLALLATAGASFAVVEVDVDTGARKAPVQLPAQVRGTVVATEMVRRGDKTALLLVAVADKSLQVHALDWNLVATQVQPGDVRTFTLGSVLPDVNPYPEWATQMWSDLFSKLLVNYDHVASQVVRMRQGSSDQQLAVAWVGADTTVRIALVGWGSAVDIGVLATSENLGTAVGPICRLAAADLFHSGTEQLILGHAAESAAVPGYVALQIFTLDANAATPSLHAECKTLVGDKLVEMPPDSTMMSFPLAVFGLQIAGGVFGSMKDIIDGKGCLGVQIMGHRCPVAAEMVCGFVPVDPSRRTFPPRDGEKPGPANMAPTVLGTYVNQADSMTPLKYRFRAFPCDLSGESVVLGAPTLGQTTVCSQILAIIHAPPFLRKFSKIDGGSGTNPSVTFTTTRGQTEGASTGSEAAWTFSDDVGVSLGLGPFNLSANYHSSELKSLTESKDDSVSSSVSFHSVTSDRDHVLVSTITYNVWQYPVLRAAAEYPAQLTVIIPLSASLSTEWKTADDLPYKPESEVGMLLSYVEGNKDGYKKDNELFPGVTSFAVTAGNDTSEVTCDLSQSVTKGQTLHLGISQSVSAHVGLSGASDQFEELPMSFGLNLGVSKSYSKSDMKTAHFNLHEGFVISITSGALPGDKPRYKYHVRPVIYQHDRLGCLVLSYDVTLGDDWERGEDVLQRGRPCLIRTYPHLQDIKRAFSREISFTKNPDNTHDIEVQIFNNGQTAVKQVACEFFDVSNAFLTEWPNDVNDVPAKGTLLGKVLLQGELEAIQRRKVKLPGQMLRTPRAYIAVKLYDGNNTGENYIYWRDYVPK